MSREADAMLLLCMLPEFNAPPPDVTDTAADAAITAATVLESFDRRTVSKVVEKRNLRRPVIARLNSRGLRKKGCHIYLDHENTLFGSGNQAHIQIIDNSEQVSPMHAIVNYNAFSGHSLLLCAFTLNSTGERIGPNAVYLMRDGKMWLASETQRLKNWDVLIVGKRPFVFICMYFFALFPLYFL